VKAKGTEIKSKSIKKIRNKGSTEKEKSENARNLVRSKSGIFKRRRRKLKTRTMKQAQQLKMRKVQEAKMVSVWMRPTHFVSNLA